MSKCLLKVQVMCESGRSVMTLIITGEIFFFLSFCQKGKPIEFKNQVVVYLIKAATQ